ncbi:NXPE family member 3-like isoform X2 [Notolabrus celidotus]|uniref:NXPE family member 3-like isoform X2 n=1 Tax=Notolabrus celidotus TaxID=1203425 RepID=UPI0014904F2D|nr:NXPE family member 3-like isoform X2 [Notolabrus celidotus]
MSPLEDQMPQEFERLKVSMNQVKIFAVLLLLAVVFFTLRNMCVLEWSPQENSANNLKTDPSMPHDFCTFKPLPAAEAKEERLLLDSIAWPETPILPSPLSLEQTSDPAHSTFTILPGRGGGERHVGDQLEVLIKIYDFRGNAKKTGGDFLVSRLHSKTLTAGVAGRVVDHLNGSYSAVFPLLWEGSAQVEVTLVHPSEAVTVLRRLNKDLPDRIIFEGNFRSVLLSERTTCNVCLHQTSQPQCNYTDLRTGEPWFCYKPQKLSCDARISHLKTGYKKAIKTEEEKLFQRDVNMKVYIKASGPDSVTVLPQTEGQTRVSEDRGKSEHSGYYYQGVWRALDGTRVQQFNSSSDISQCLNGKMVYMYGDSTMRQWFEYLDASLPDAKEVNLNSPDQAGPFMIWDNVNKLLVTYRIHGLPLRIHIIPASKESYIANELDGLVGGKNTVVVLGIWAHFSTFPIEFYIRRLQSIRRAVVRLLERAPGTLVVIRTANLQYMTVYNVMGNGDWFSVQVDKVLRAMFKGLNVRMVDAWEMVLDHDLPHNLHPQPPIIKNMINVLLSYICPKK